MSRPDLGGEAHVLRLIDNKQKLLALDRSGAEILGEETFAVSYDRGCAVAEGWHGFRTSTARRSTRFGVATRVVVAAIALIAAIVAVHEIGRERAEPQTAVVPTQTATPILVVPSPTPTPRRLVEYSSKWVVASAPTSTPNWWPAPSPPRRSQPSPTPSRSRCIVVRWSAHQSLAARGNVLIDIHAINRCGRKLQPHEISIWIAGYRDGAVVQTATGQAFNEVYPGRSTNFAIGLPGSIDWYDVITVEVMD